jgi:hypothetical protein
MLAGNVWSECPMWTGILNGGKSYITPDIPAIVE